MKKNKLETVVKVSPSSIDIPTGDSNGFDSFSDKDAAHENKEKGAILFISMKKENLGIYKDSIKKIGDDYIFLFDIDNTLYKMSEALYEKLKKSFCEAFNKLRTLHLSKNKDIPEVTAALKESPLYIRSFLKYFDMTPSQIENYREGCDIKSFIKRDEKLREFLMDLPYRKWAFTNGLKSHAEIVLEAVDITECFEGVICCDDQAKDIIGKPMKEAFDFVENLLGIKNRSKVIFFDDHLVSIQASNAVGWRGIHVKKEDDLIDLINELYKEIKQ